MPQLNDESFHKEEEYHINSKDKEEVLDPYQTQGYDIHTNPRTSLVWEVIPKSVSKCFFFNMINSNNQNVPTSGTANSGSLVP